MMEASPTRIHGQGRKAKCAALSHSVASSECRSSLAQNIRGATKPPPPGSAPGYQVAHHPTETYTRNVNMGIQAEFKSGTKLSTDPAPPDARPRARSTSA